MERLHAKCLLEGDKWAVNEVHCYFEFPKAPLGEPRVTVRMSETQYRMLPNNPSFFELSTAIEEDDSLHIHILGKNCNFSERKETIWPHGLSTFEGEISCADLTVREAFNPERDDGAPTVREYTLTPSTWARPWHMVTKSYTGEVEVRRNDLLTVSHSGRLFEIDTRFDYVEFNDKRGYEAIETLVAREKKAEDSHSIEAGLLDYSGVDDICRLIQLASRSYVTSVGSVESSVRGIIHHYRMGRTRPDQTENRRSRWEYLVDVSYAPDFLQSAFDALRGAEAWSDRIRSAIAALVPHKARTVEGGFIAQFSALEELIEQFVREKGGRRILGNTQFRKLRKQIEGVIGDSIEHPIIREQIERQLPALNNVPLQDRFEAFCRHFSIQYDDLWPAFGPSRASLYKIRNRLVHSKALLEEEVLPVAYAGDALKALLERAVLSLLKWPVAKTDISPAAFAGKYVAGHDLPEFVTKLEDLWSHQ